MQKPTVNAKKTKRNHPSDRPTDWLTDIAGYWVACTHLVKVIVKFSQNQRCKQIPHPIKWCKTTFLVKKSTNDRPTVLLAFRFISRCHEKMTHLDCYCCYCCCYYYCCCCEMNLRPRCFAPDSRRFLWSSETKSFFLALKTSTKTKEMINKMKEFVNKMKYGFSRQ